MLPDEDVKHLHRLRNRTRGILEAALGSGKEIALLDTPRHRNLGDSLIWAGELNYFSSLGSSVVYHTDVGRWRDSDVQRFPRDAVIAFHGGGNFGDLYPAHEEFRRHIVRTFRHRRIVVLPQTIHYSSKDAGAHADRDYGMGDDLLVLARDQRSLQNMAETMPGVAVTFCPDLAFGAPLPQHGPTSSGGVTVLARSDDEATAAELGYAAPDWRFSAVNKLAWQVGMTPGRAFKRLPKNSREATLTAMQRANARLLRVNMLAAAEQYRGTGAVATNRLHAHILACMIGIPHWVTDNSYGKIRPIYDEYSGGFSTAHYVDSLDEAVRAACAATHTD